MLEEKISIKLFDPQTVSDELWERFFTLYEKHEKELFPNDPAPSRKIIKKSIKNPDPNYENYRWIIFLDDDEYNIIGLGKAFFNTEKAPAYQANKHVAFGYISIDKEYRGRGIGTELLKTIVTKVREEGKSVLHIDALLESGINFCKKFGGSAVLEEEESRLNITDVNWKMVNKWREEGARRAKGVKIERFKDVPEKDIDEYCRIHSETENQVPLGDIEWTFDETPKTRRNREKRYKNLGATWTTFISREKDGTISGLTETLYFFDRPTILDQLLTGVKEEYRGRGLGKWLKAEMLTYIKEKFPKVKVVATGFAVTNAPMIAINKKLGFKNSNSWITYKFQIEELHKKFGF